VLYDDWSNLHDWLVLGSGYGSRFIFEMHEKIRTKLVTEYFHNETGKVIARILEPVMNDSRLVVVEKILVYTHLLSDKKRAYTYFCQFENDLMNGIQLYAKAISYSLGSFYMATSRMLLEAQEILKAREVLKLISVNDSAFPDSLKLLKTIESDERSILETYVAKEILSNPDWESRLAIFETYLEACRTVWPKYHDATPALNHLCLKPFALVGDRPEAISEFVGTCLSYLDLLERIPNLEAVFRSNAMLFHNATLEGAIWNPVLRTVVSSEKLEFWRAVAMVHRFASGGSKHEEYLYLALKIFKSQKGNLKQYSFGWDQLLECAKRSVLKSDSFSEREKKVMDLQISIAQSPELASPSQMAEYLEIVPQKNYEVLKYFTNQDNFTAGESFNLKVLRKFGETIWYRNVDLERMWNHSKDAKLTDLMWRIASIAKFRQIINPNLVASWSISGENRSLYSTPKIQKSHIQLLLGDLSPLQKKLCQAIIDLEGTILDLLPEIDNTIKDHKWKATSERDVRLGKSLGSLSWLKPIKKRYASSSSPRVEAGPLAPFFAGAMPVNDWVDSLGWLGEVTGVSYLFDKRTQILKISEQVNAQLKPRPESKVESSPVKWVKSLGHVHRAAWYDLVECYRKLEGNEIEHAYSVMLVRMASLICAGHAIALQSLVEMGANLPLIRSLENWILSEDLTKLRSVYGVESKLSLPDFLALEPLSATKKNA
jgi:hypothetical protein